MAKLKKDTTISESEVSNPQETIQESEISPNTSINAEANTTIDTIADTSSDTISSNTTESESKGTTTSDTGRKDVTESQTITSKQDEKEKSPTQKRSEKSDKERLDSFTMEVLKAYSNYASLYVDKLGCAYTPDTPEAIRGSAILYKNPHFKSE